MLNKREHTGGITIYVAAKGNGISEKGSEAHPYRTLEKAQTAVREILAKNPDCSIVVNVEPGSYFLDSPLIFTEADSPREGNLVVYRANKKSAGDIVEISGAKVLMTGSWEDYQENPAIKVTQLEAGLELDVLFVNRKEQILARYPNYKPETLPLGGAAGANDIRSRAAGYANPSGGYIRALHNSRWGGNSYRITGRDASNPLGLAYEWVGDNNRGSGMDKSAIVIENVFEELDAPMEWYYEKQTGKLFYYPEEGLDLSSAVMEGAVISELIKFIGSGNEKTAGNILLEGFKFWGTKRTMFTVGEKGKEYVPLLRGDWCVVRAGAVYLENAQNVMLKNLEFVDLGGNGIFISGYNKGHLISNNEFINAGSTCIQVAGLPEAVYEPSFWEHEYYKNIPGFVIHKSVVEEPYHAGPRSEAYPRDITISENHMYNIGVFEKQSSGVNLSICSRIRVLRNTIHKSARSCINVNDGTFGGHEIAYNDMFDSQRETTDHGPFNSWGRDRFWSVPEYNAQGKFGDTVRPYALIDAVETITIHDNRFHHESSRPHTWGIDLDDGSTNYDIYNNLGLGIGIKLREGFDRKVHNNIFIDGQLQIHCTYKQANDEINKNIVVNSKPWEFAGQSNGDEAGLKEGNYKVDGNWYYNSGEEIVLPEFFQELGFDRHGVVGEDPGFLDRGKNDYTVTNSQAMEKCGFVNFSMDGFGKPGCACQSPIYTKNTEGEKAKPLRRECWQGAVISELNHAIISSTASGDSLGVFFQEVPDGSTAYHLGFRKFDIVKKINQQEIISMDGFLLLLMEMGKERTAEAEVFRATEYKTFLLSAIEAGD